MENNPRVIRPSYTTLLVALSEQKGSEIDPKYTILNKAVSEVFESCYDGANWLDQADMSSIMKVQKELGLI
jgi:hypothetical protein